MNLGNIFSGMSGGNNPMQMIMQFMQGGGQGNPQQLIQQITQNNPQANAIMQQYKQSGMSAEQFARQLAKQKGIDINQMMSMFGGKK